MKYVFLLVVVGLTGCAAAVTPVASGGSKSDGVLVYSYELGAARKPVIDWDALLVDATAKCRNWGYQSAELFGSGEQSCTWAQHNAFGQPTGCMRHRTDIKYQCHGGD